MANKLISAEELITAIRDDPYIHGRAYARTRDHIDEAKAVDAVEVVHGRWVMKETMIKSPFAKNAYCSVCLEETSYAHNYCPNCGAKMDAAAGCGGTGG